MSKNDLSCDKSMFIPKYWLSEHNPIGDKFKVPGDDEIYFIALKSPLSEALNNLLPKEKQWGPKEVMKKISNMIDQENIRDWIFTAIELSDQIDQPVNEWDNLRVDHHYCPISHNYLTNEVESFVNLIKPINDTQFKNLYIVSCNNGHDRCAVAISTYLMRNYDLEIFQAYTLFKKSRWPGIYSVRAADYFSMYKKKDEKPINCAQRKDEFQIQNKSDEISDSNLTIERLSDFKRYFCERIDNSTMINNYNDFLNQKTSIYSFDLFPESDSPKPILEYLEFNDRSNSDDNEADQAVTMSPGFLKEIRKHAYRCSFVPSGLFIYLLAFEPNYIVINYGYNNFYNIPCHIKCKFPFLCTAYAVETSDYLEIYISDILSYQNETFEKVVLDDRITMIYYDILPNITISKRAYVKLKYRPMGRMTDLVKLYDFLNSKEAKFQYNFRTSGLSLIQQSWPPGKSIFVPIIPEVHLLFLMNATDVAVLYARSDDNKTIVPVKYFVIPKKERFGGLHDKVIKFSITEPNNPKSYWKPLTICKSRLPDYISYVKAIDNFAVNEKNTSEILKTLEETVKKGLEDQKKQKSELKATKK